MPHNLTLGHTYAAELAQALNVFNAGPVLAGHSRHILFGVNPRGDVLNRSLDDVLNEATQVLIQSGRVYRYGNSIVIEEGSGESGSLVTLGVDSHAEQHAAANLTDLLAVRTGSSDYFVEASLPPRIAASLLAYSLLRQSLPEIRLYSYRPVFDEDFGLKGPGYHGSSKVLIHGPQIEIVQYEPDHGAGTKALDRLPPHLAKLLGEFAWRSDADLVNSLAALLTGLLCNHFVDQPHPIVVIDGNQPGIGKTLLAQCMGRVLDGREPPRISLTGDEELEKKLCSHIRDSRSSLIFLDNVRDRMVSEVVEQNALNPILRFRILGSSSSVERHNSYLWIVTSNATKAASDVVTRALPIRLSVEGDPRKRKFSGRPLDYAKDHRLEILGELAGMVHRWLQKGKPLGTQQYRCEQWASAIGGILEVAGLGEFFLGNIDEAAAEMSDDLNQLEALAEYVHKHTQEDLIYWSEVAYSDPTNTSAISSPEPIELADPAKVAAQGGLPAGGWVQVFERAGVLTEKLNLPSAKAKATMVGQFLSKMVDRSVMLDAEAQRLTITLRKRHGRSNKQLFSFEVRALESPPVNEAAETAANSVQTPRTSGWADGQVKSPEGTPVPSGDPVDTELDWL